MAVGLGAIFRGICWSRLRLLWLVLEVRRVGWVRWGWGRELMGILGGISGVGRIGGCLGYRCFFRIFCSRLFTLVSIFCLSS